MPMGEYANFEDCVKKNQDKKDPEAYCGSIKNKVEGKAHSFFTDDISCEIIEKKGKKKYYVTGYISTGDRDIVNDVITEKALSAMLGQIQNKNIKLDVEHEAIENPVSIPIGRIVEAKRDEKGIFVKAVLNDSHSRFKEVWASIKSGFLDAFSIGYKAVDYVHQVVDGIKTRMLNGVDLLNVALTGNPINPECKMVNAFEKSLKEVSKMEKKDETPEEESPEEKEAKEPEQKAEEPKVEEPEEETEEEPEQKSEVDVKGLMSKIESLEKKNAELEKEMKSMKEKLDKPILKAEQKNIDEIKEKKDIKANPLDLI